MVDACKSLETLRQPSCFFIPMGPLCAAKGLLFGNRKLLCGLLRLCALLSCRTAGVFSKRYARTHTVSSKELRGGGRSLPTLERAQSPWRPSLPLRAPFLLISCCTYGHPPTFSPFARSFLVALPLCSATSPNALGCSQASWYEEESIAYFRWGVQSPWCARPRFPMAEDAIANTT
jgi:hypothetical protein